MQLINNENNSSPKPLSIKCILSIKAISQPPELDYTNSAIESSKSWIDVDCAGDNIIGHKLDIFLPKEGTAPFLVVVTIWTRRYD